MPVEFNQQNVNQKIQEIKNMPEPGRNQIADAIQNDLKGWLRDNFSLNELYNYSLDALDDAIAQEWSEGIALAIRHDNWNLSVVFPTDEPPAARPCQDTSQAVKGSYNPTTGSYTIEKTITWKY